MQRHYVISQKSLKVGTHDGTFHCDEVFACVMLWTLPEFAEPLHNQKLLAHIQ